MYVCVDNSCKFPMLTVHFHYLKKLDYNFNPYPLDGNVDEHRNPWNFVLK